MAKKKHEEASEQMEQLDESHVVEETGQPDPLTLTSPNDPDALRAMFAGIEIHDQTIAGIEETLATARALRSRAIQAIVVAIGNKGPWNIGGKLISVAVRGETYSFRTQSEAKLSL